MSKSFPSYKQYDSKDCGPTALKIVAKHYGNYVSVEKLRELAETTRLGTSLQGITNAAEAIGLRTLPAKINLQQLQEAPLPAVLHWNKNHFVVLYKITKTKLYISDPAHGLLTYNRNAFIKSWIGVNANDTTEEGIVLLLEPTPKFYEKRTNEKGENLNFTFLYKYLIKYRKFLWQMGFSLFAGSLLQLIFPFLTQSVVDIGIKNQDIHFVYLILIAQLFLFIGKTSVEIIRGWILLHLSTRINISLISDFFIKLMSLPIAFFDTRFTGDILQRINDHSRIERILTSSSLNVLFSLTNLIIFGFILAYYNLLIFGIFLLGSFLYFLWIILFLKKRRDLDYKSFSELSNEQSKVIELINGMQDIKLNNAEKQFRWSWEHLQARLFKLSIAGLKLNQYQSVGSGFINEFKNILITIVSAKLVIEGNLTLGMLLAISYIVGQLNSPIGTLIRFVQEIQDAKISLERLSEIHNKPEEENSYKVYSDIPKHTGFEIKDVNFRYKGSQQAIFTGLNLKIKPKKVTAIVGASGSGKTTLLKLLLKFYEPSKGEILVDKIPLSNVSHTIWRDRCGVVMQEGYIFNDTVANNIAIGKTKINKENLKIAIEISNCKEFIDNLPLSVNTTIGMEGIGLSTGQKQRILIARALYNDPNCLFFDEATSALDASNEKEIMQKLQEFFVGKTVVVIAHRLSTVKNADQIVVLDKGKVIELGNHTELISKKGAYYKLIKNQLELGS